MGESVGWDRHWLVGHVHGHVYFCWDADLLPQLQQHLYYTFHTLRRGGCYKHAFYGIESHRCMEATPSLVRRGRTGRQRGVIYGG